MKYATTSPQTLDDVPTVHRLVQGDARDLSFIPDASVHLVVTSPPYWTLNKAVTYSLRQVDLHSAFECALARDEWHGVGDQSLLHFDPASK